MIEIISHNHASELISLSGAYLEQDESENNRPLGYAYRLAEDPHAYDSEQPLLLSILERRESCWCCDDDTLLWRYYLEQDWHKD